MKEATSFDMLWWFLAMLFFYWLDGCKWGIYQLLMFSCGYWLANFAWDIIRSRN